MNKRSVAASSKLLVACVLAASSLAAAAAPPRYHLVDLGAYTQAYRVDTLGDVAGSIRDGTQPAYWHDGAWHRLEAQYENGAFATAIDEHGGGAFTVISDVGDVTSTWVRRGGGEWPIRPQAAGDIWAWDIASDGTVAGNTGGPGGSHCYVWRESQTRTLASTGDQCFAQAINDSHQVAGAMNTTPSGDLQAFIWQDGQFKMLVGLGGTYTVANDINEAGHVALVATTDTGASHAALYDGRQTIDLGAPNGASDSAALGINDRDVVVGRWFDFAEHAFVAHGIQILDLAPLVDDLQGLDLGGATGVNNAGVIVGNAMRNGVRHAYMLLPMD